VSSALVPLLKLDRHHEAYDILVNIDVCKFEPVPTDDSKFNFSKANREIVINEVNSIDWVNIFAWKRVDDCVDLFYEIVFDCFDHNVPIYRPRGGDWLL
jgi:hypothetical protein